MKLLYRGVDRLLNWTFTTWKGCNIKIIILGRESILWFFPPIYSHFYLKHIKIVKKNLKKKAKWLKTVINGWQSDVLWSLMGRECKWLRLCVGYHCCNWKEYLYCWKMAAFSKATSTSSTLFDLEANSTVTPLIFGNLTIPYSSFLANWSSIHEQRILNWTVCKS